MVRLNFQHFGILSLCAGLVFAGAAQAEIHECNGKWTNLPCEGTVGHVMKESHHESALQSTTTQAGTSQTSAEKSASPATEPLAPRSDLIRKLRKISDEFKRKGGVSLSSPELEGFRKLCEDRTKPFQDCLSLFNQQSQHLTELNQKKDDLDLKAERNQIERDKLKK